MKRYIIGLVAMLFVAMFAQSQTLQKKAENAYLSEKYNRAIELYNLAIEKDGLSTGIYYNLGNAYYKVGDLGHAVLSYERALLLDPNNADARASLAFVNSKLKDKPSNDENIIEALSKKIMTLTSANGWGVIGIVSFLLLLGAAGLYVFTGTVALRKTGFFAGLIFLTVCVIANVVGYRMGQRIRDSKSGVVISDNVILSVAPREPKTKADEAFVLHEGTKIYLLDSVEIKSGQAVAAKWYDVQVDDNHRAWIKAKDFEKI